jgi:hypothetical protein
MSMAIKGTKLKQEETNAQQSGPVTVMKWHDKGTVLMISTYHDAEMKSETKRGKETQKPVCVIHFNKWMSGIDLKDQLLQTYLLEKKHMHKWYMKLFTRLEYHKAECNDNLWA